MKQTRTFLFCFVVLLAINKVQAQQSRIDSLWSVYKDGSKPDSLRVQAINDIAWAAYRSDPDTAVILAKEEIAYAQAIPGGKGKKWEAKAYSTLAACYNLKSDFPHALEYYQQSLKIRQELGDKTGVGTSYGNIGFVYKQMSDFPRALEYYLKALKTDEEAGNKEGIGYCYNNIGLVYYNANNFEKALEYHEKGLKIQAELGNKRDIAITYVNLGNVMYSLNKYDKARDYYNKALTINLALGDPASIASCYNNLGLLSTSEGNDQEALKYYLLSLRLKKELGSMLGIATCYTNLADLYYKLGDYKKALVYADSSLHAGEEAGDIDNQRLAYKCKALSYAGEGRYKEAYESHVKFKALTDSIFNAENSKQIGDMKTRFEVEKKEAELNAKAEAKQAIGLEEKKRQQLVIYSVVGILVIVCLFSLVLYKRFRLTTRQKKIIEIKSRETEDQKHLVEEKQREIIESITYAKRLQEAILPPREFITAYLPDNFVFYRPKDIVAGDFYWAEQVDDLFFIAAADSTGHGVPGAMVSVVCSGALNRAVNEFHLRETGKILDKARELVLDTFAKGGGDVKDGMDISLLCVDKKNKRFFWSGANNPLWYVQDGSMKEIKADKQPIGKTDHPAPFTTHEALYRKGTVFYLFTDGFADQFGGPKGKKFKYKQLEEVLLTNHSLNMEEQSSLLLQQFEAWRGKLEQVDDVCVIGIRL